MLRAWPVPADLSPWIDGAMTVRLAPGPGVSRFPAMPQAMLTMQRSVSADPAVPWSPPVFHTLATGPTHHPRDGALVAVGLVLQPAAAVCLLGGAGGAPVDAVLPWADLAGPAEAERVIAEVQRAAADRERLAALAGSVRRTLARLSRGDDLARARRLCTLVGRHGVQAHGPLGLGRRQLERRCRALIGLAPTTFQQLVRFQGALSSALLREEGARCGAALALDAGYCDQSHLGRALRRRAGAPLGVLLSQARDDAAWWSLASHRLMRRVTIGPDSLGPGIGAQPDVVSADGRLRHHR